MSCHNGSKHNDYAGPGIENPHPFGGEATIRCTTCHGGNSRGATAAAAHVPPPPEIGDEAFQEVNAEAYFNRLTLTGIDKYEDYEVNGVTYTALDYLMFVNPGDLRVVTQGMSCGACHPSHAECVSKSLLATEAGILSGASYTMGVDTMVPESVGLYSGTAADLAFRANFDLDFVFDPGQTGPVGELYEYPVYSSRFDAGPDDLFQNPDYDAAELDDDVNADNSVISNSPLANLFHEQVAFTCGDCHLGSAGANNRTGDYRSSGCTSCHMRYSTNGRSYSSDPNIKKNEPLDPDDIDEPERAHVRRHLITSVARTLQSGEVVQGMDDYTCAGCHQGSNRTVMQFWGIRLDQNADLRRGVQYPANPVSYRTTRNDHRLFHPDWENREFNGRNANQYILFEDYDGDGRDDTPPDVHYEAGMGCIDCHGSHDLHGGKVGDPGNSPILSRQEQAGAIRCEDCHGSIDAYANVVAGITYAGTNATIGVDSEGNPMKHVTLEADGNYYLTSRLTGNRHYIPQTRDTVVDNGKVDPFTNDPVYSVKASYAMGRADGDSNTGLGPHQTGGVTPGFSHSDNMSCVSCHASWTNTCTGCHLKGEYNGGNNFSNITGERIVFRERNADFVYQSPLPFQLGVDTHNKVAPITSNTTTFFQWRDRNGEFSKTFAFTDRNGGGNNPGGNKNIHPALSHNTMMPHSIRGKVNAENEGPRYCVACHLTTDALDNFGTQYDDFRTAIANNDFGSLDYDLLKTHIGQNPSNQLNSPFFVHMVAGLGTGLFLFDENGCPTNPLDADTERFDCNFQAPADNFDPLDLNVMYNLDKIVEPTGVSNGSNTHQMLDPGSGPNLRDGSTDPNFSGPLGRTLIELLSDPVNGVVLDSWIDADGASGGDVDDFIAD